MSELKPCPFCGGVPGINKHFRGNVWGLMHRCPVLGPMLFEWTDDREWLVQRWNTRAEIANAE